MIKWLLVLAGTGAAAAGFWYWRKHKAALPPGEAARREYAKQQSFDPWADVRARRKLPPPAEVKAAQERVAAAQAAAKLAPKSLAFNLTDAQRKTGEAFKAGFQKPIPGTDLGRYFRNGGYTGGGLLGLRG